MFFLNIILVTSIMTYHATRMSNLIYRIDHEVIIYYEAFEIKIYRYLRFVRLYCLIIFILVDEILHFYCLTIIYYDYGPCSGI